MNLNGYTLQTTIPTIIIPLDTTQNFTDNLLSTPLNSLIK